MPGMDCILKKGKEGTRRLSPPLAYNVHLEEVSAFGAHQKKDG